MSDNQPLNENQRREVQHTAELEVRRYFDHYLNNVWPKQQVELEKHCRKRIEVHDKSPEAHGAVARKFNRVFYVALGVAVGSGAGGFGLARLLTSLVG